MMRIPPVTKALLIAMGAMFLLQYVLGNEAFLPFMLWPWGDFPIGTGADGLPVTVGFMPWQLVTYVFLHGSFLHLFFNAFALFQFGGAVEDVWGPRRFALFFFVCAAGAAVCQMLVLAWTFDPTQGPIPTIGASGGIFGVLLAFAMLFPNNKLILIPFPFPIAARTFVIIYGVIELYLGVTGTQAGVAHFAHLGGLLFGWLLIRYWRGQPPFSRRKPPPPKFRIVN